MDACQYEVSIKGKIETMDGRKSSKGGGDTFLAVEALIWFALVA